MDAKRLPARPDLKRYEHQAQDLLKTWEPGENRRIADARLVIANSYGFENWTKFKKHIEAVARKSSTVSKFEAAVDAVVTGNTKSLQTLLKQNPKLIKARSTFAHHSTLLHYVSANGVEGYRQQTPSNAVAVATLLLDAGAEVDAVADAYGKGTTLGLVATSIHPVVAGVQIELMETLLKHGASVEGAPSGWNPLLAALHNGRPDAAVFLVKYGAKLDFEAAAGVGQLVRVKELLKKASKTKKTAGLLWACAYGRTAVVRFLLTHSTEVPTNARGATGLHWAAYGGHSEIVRLLLKRKHPVNGKDQTFNATPLGWALHASQNTPPENKGANYNDVVSDLVAAGAIQ